MYEFRQSKKKTKKKEVFFLFGFLCGWQRRNCMKRTAQRDDKQHGRYWSVNVIRSTITKGIVTSIVLYTFQFTIWDFWFGHNYATTTCQTRFCTFVHCNTVYVFWVFRPYLFFFPDFLFLQFVRCRHWNFLFF